MANVFSPQEILRIAAKVEENGERLYGNLKNKSKDIALQEMWRYLKEQEDAHRRTFQEMLEKVGDYIVYEFSPGEYEAYLKAISAEYIFTQELIEQKVNEGFSSDLAAVDFGIYVEKELILTYSALKDCVLSEKQAVLDKVIDEERRHLVRLVLLKDKLGK